MKVEHAEMHTKSSQRRQTELSKREKKKQLQEIFTATVNADRNFLVLSIDEVNNYTMIPEITVFHYLSLISTLLNETL